MKLFDTTKKEYVTNGAGPVFRMYVCGITPYDSAHFGHVFTFMTYDFLQRRLEDLGHEVKMVRNITDVDEPIYAKAADLGIHYTELARTESESFGKLWIVFIFVRFMRNRKQVNTSIRWLLLSKNC